MITIAENEWDVRDHEVIGSGEPDPRELRAAALELRRAASAKIVQLEKQWTPKIAEAETAFADAARGLTAAKAVFDEAVRVHRDAYQRHESMIHQRDKAIGEQERIIRENPDVELHALINRLDNEIYNQRQTEPGSRRLKSRLAKLENALAKAKSLAHDHTIVGMVKLEAAMMSVATSGGLN
jgi:DNA repair exonuclease SbcCD ATPase subunit